MTEPRRKAPGPVPTMITAVACFLVVFEFLAFRAASGQDPALGSGNPGAGAGAASISRPVKRVVVTKIIPAQSSVPAGPTVTAAPSAPAPAAPVVSSSS